MTMPNDLGSSGSPGVPLDSSAPSPAEGTGPLANGEELPTTLEERDAYWMKRMAGKDRSDNAEKAALRAENDRLRSLLTQNGSPAPAATDGQTPPDATTKELLAQYQRRAEEAERQAKMAEKRAKFPGLSQQFEDRDPNLYALDDATLAALDAAFTFGNDGQGGPVASTSPRRPPVTPTKDYSQMSKDDLLRELAQKAPMMAQAEKAGQGQW